MNDISLCKKKHSSIIIADNLQTKNSQLIDDNYGSIQSVKALFSLRLTT